MGSGRASSLAMVPMSNAGLPVAPRFGVLGVDLSAIDSTLSDGGTMRFRVRVQGDLVFQFVESRLDIQ